MVCDSSGECNVCVRGCVLNDVTPRQYQREYWWSTKGSSEQDLGEFVSLLVSLCVCSHFSGVLRT